MNMLTLTVWFFFCITSKRVDTSQVSRGVHSRAELSESPVQHTHMERANRSVLKLKSAKIKKCTRTRPLNALLMHGVRETGPWSSVCVWPTLRTLTIAHHHLRRADHVCKVKRTLQFGGVWVRRLERADNSEPHTAPWTESAMRWQNRHKRPWWIEHAWPVLYRLNVEFKQQKYLIIIARVI